MDSPAPYRERLAPSWWLPLALLLIVPAVLAVFLPISLEWGAVVAVVVYAAALAALWLSAPVIAVDGGELRAGRARIGVEHLGEPEALEGDAAREAMRTGWDARAHHVTVAWTRSLVRVPVEDPADPTSSWVVSSRRPHALAAAIEAARG